MPAPASTATRSDPLVRAETQLGHALIVRAERATVIRQDCAANDFPMLLAGLSSTMAVPGYDRRRHRSSPASARA